MSENDLEHMFQDGDDDVAAPEQETEQPSADTQDEPAAEDKGVKAPDTEQEEPAADGPAEADDDNKIPLAAALDDRRKRQQAEQAVEDASKRERELLDRIARLEGQMAARQHPEPQQQKPESVPDPLDDPEGFRRHVREEATRDARNMMLESDRIRAEAQYGAEAVRAAYNEAARLDAAGQGQDFASLASSTAPYSELMNIMAQRKQRAEMATKAGLLGDHNDLDAWAKANGYVKAPPTPTDITRAPSPGRGREAVDAPGYIDANALLPSDMFEA